MEVFGCLAMIMIKNSFSPQSVSWFPLVIDLSPHPADTSLFFVSILLPFLECLVNGTLCTSSSVSVFFHLADLGDSNRL